MVGAVPVRGHSAGERMRLAELRQYRAAPAWHRAASRNTGGPKGGVMVGAVGTRWEALRLRRLPQLRAQLLAALLYHHHRQPWGRHRACESGSHLSGSVVQAVIAAGHSGACSLGKWAKVRGSARANLTTKIAAYNHSENEILRFWPRRRQANSGYRADASRPRTAAR